MLDVEAAPAINFPDDPLKWDGWSKYRSPNPYERLCLNPATRPDDEQILQHCTALLTWWRRKLPLKTQPSNPMAQLLGRGLDEAAQCLVQARMQLLDRKARQQIDDQLAAQAEQEAIAEFSKYVAFSLARRVLTPEAEADLLAFGQRSGLSETQTRTCIETELQRHKAKRAAPTPPPAAATPETQARSADAEKEFQRILRLAAVDLADATARVRRIFLTLAENLGINLERAEDLLDAHLDAVEFNLDAVQPPAQTSRAIRPSVKAVTVTPPRPLGTSARPQPRVAPATPSRPATAASTAPRVQPVFPRSATGALPAVFNNPANAPMMLVPPGEFVMGSDAPDAAPNEQPLTPVTLSEFYMARYLVTNAQYEQFDPSHRQKRMPGAGDDHPVVYVTSFEAAKYCHWLSQKDGKTYRLPTEAEWEYAARGTDGRKYPWGNQERRGDLANFADASTHFAWRDPLIHDGYSETSPLGAFPRGVSPFGIEDMAGNVWEWCLDFFQPLAGTPRRNPRGLASGPMRVYRGGSWKSRFSNLRATVRSSNAPNYSSNDVGFRIVCEVVAAEVDENADAAVFTFPEQAH